MYKVCVVDENPLIRNVIKSVLASQEFEVTTLCDMGEKCPDFLDTCHEECMKKEPCRNLLIIDNCWRESRGIKFLKFIDKHQCSCVHSFKVLYGCEPIKDDEIEILYKLNVHVVNKRNAAEDILPLVDKYKIWYQSNYVMI